MRTESDRSAPRGRPRIRPTWDGLGLVGLSILLGLAAINSGNNLVYLLAATLLGFFIVGTILNLLSLGGIQAIRRHPHHVHAGDPVEVDVTLRRRRRSTAAFSVNVREVYEGPEAGGWILWLAPGRPTRVSYPLVFPRRGLRLLEAIEVSTLHPFGIVERRRRLPVRSEVIVYPEIRKLRPVKVEAAAGRRVEPKRSWATTEEQEFHGVREYREGDNPKWIHWRTSARMQNLMVRDLRDPKRDRVTVVLDTSMPNGRPDSRLEDLERGIVLAASILYDAYRRQRAFSLIAFVPAPVDLPADRGRTHLHRCLDTLARLAPAPADRTGPLRRLARSRAAEGEEVHCLSLGGEALARGPWRTVDLSRCEDRDLLGEEDGRVRPIGV